MKDIWIGDSIKFYRTQLGYTLEELSDISGVEPSHISHAENGNYYLSFHNIIQILNALNINFSDCYGANSEKLFVAKQIKDYIAENFNESEVRYFIDLLAKLSKAEEVRNE